MWAVGTHLLELKLVPGRVYICRKLELRAELRLELGTLLWHENIPNVG